MKTQNIGILHPGEMGISVAASAKILDIPFSGYRRVAARLHVPEQNSSTCVSCGVFQNSVKLAP